MPPLKSLSLPSVFAVVAVGFGVMAPVSGAVQQVSAGGAQTCAVTFATKTSTSGTLFCWGAGSRGRLGRNDSKGASTAIPIKVTSLGTNVKQVDVGQAHACALLKEATVKCWGANSTGQLGDGRPDITGTAGVISSTTLDQIKGLVLSAAPSVGQLVRVLPPAATTDQYLSNGTQITAVTKSSTAGGGSTYTLTLSKPALLAGTGLSAIITDSNANKDQPAPVFATGLSNVVDVTAGYGHSCALKADGTIFCWGDGGNGRLGQGNTYDYNYPVQVAGITTATDVSAGYIHTCAVLADTTARCWGSNRSGQLGDNSQSSRTNPVVVKQLTALGVGSPVTLTGVDRISGGYGHSCALMLDKTVKCWGENQFSELGGISNLFTDPKNNLTFSLIAQEVPGITNAVSLSTSYLHTCAVLETKKVVCWGHNSQGDTGSGAPATPGDPPPPTIATPTVVAGLPNSVDVSTGNSYTCALLAPTGSDASGAINCWGFGGNGQLGNGGTARSLVPVPGWGGPTIDIEGPPFPGAPTVPLARTNKRTAKFVFSNTQVGATFSYSVDGAAFVDLASNTLTLNKVAVGAHKLTVVAKDVWGNQSIPRVITWTVV